MSRLWPFLAPEKRDAAGSPAVLVPPSPHLLGLLCYLNSSNVTRNGASRKRRAKAMMHTTPTRHFLCRIQYSQCSAQYLQKGTKSLQREGLNIMDFMNQSLRKHLAFTQFCRRHFIINETL